jgi:hypothetical protein
VPWSSRGPQLRRQLAIDRVEEVHQELLDRREPVGYKFIALRGAAVPVIEGDRIGPPSEPRRVAIVESHEAGVFRIKERQRVF